MKRRQLFERSEVIRRAYLFVARNETLPDTIRTRAQQALHRMPKRSTYSEIKNTCIKTGKQRGEFGLQAKEGDRRGEGRKEEREGRELDEEGGREVEVASLLPPLRASRERECMY